MPKFVVESDIDVRTFDRPYHQRQVIGEFSCIADTYQFIEKYIADTKIYILIFADIHCLTRMSLKA